MITSSIFLKNTAGESGRRWDLVITEQTPFWGEDGESVAGVFESSQTPKIAEFPTMQDAVNHYKLKGHEVIG